MMETGSLCGRGRFARVLSLQAQTSSMNKYKLNCHQQQATVGPQKNRARDHHATAQPRKHVPGGRQPGDRKIQSQRGEENFQRLGQSRGGIARHERTEGSQQKRT